MARALMARYGVLKMVHHLLLPDAASDFSVFKAEPIHNARPTMADGSGAADNVLPVASKLAGLPFTARCLNTRFLMASTSQPRQMDSSVRFLRGVCAALKSGKPVQCQGDVLNNPGVRQMLQLLALDLRGQQEHSHIVRMPAMLLDLVDSALRRCDLRRDKLFYATQACTVLLPDTGGTLMEVGHFAAGAHFQGCERGNCVVDVETTCDGRWPFDVSPDGKRQLSRLSTVSPYVCIVDKTSAKSREGMPLVTVSEIHSGSSGRKYTAESLRALASKRLEQKQVRAQSPRGEGSCPNAVYEQWLEDLAAAHKAKAEAPMRGAHKAKAEALVKQADVFATAGKLSRSADMYDMALHVDPSSHVALNNKGFVLLRMGKAGEAEAALSQALQLAPSSVAAQINLAKVKLHQGDKDAAAELLLQVLESTQNQNRTARNLYRKIRTEQHDTTLSETPPITQTVTVTISRSGNQQLGILFNADEGGIRITRVNPDSLLKGDMKEGDLVVSINDQGISQMDSKQILDAFEAQTLVMQVKRLCPVANDTCADSLSHRGLPSFPGRTLAQRLQRRQEASESEVILTHRRSELETKKAVERQHKNDEFKMTIQLGMLARADKRKAHEEKLEQERNLLKKLELKLDQEKDRLSKERLLKVEQEWKEAENLRELGKMRAEQATQEISDFSRSRRADEEDKLLNFRMDEIERKQYADELVVRQAAEQSMTQSHIREQIELDREVSNAELQQHMDRVDSSVATRGSSPVRFTSQSMSMVSEGTTASPLPQGTADDASSSTLHDAVDSMKETKAEASSNKLWGKLRQELLDVHHTRVNEQEPIGMELKLGLEGLTVGLVKESSPMAGKVIEGDVIKAINGVEVFGKETTDILLIFQNNLTYNLRIKRGQDGTAATLLAKEAQAARLARIE